jgi:hypothetical protein
MLGQARTTVLALSTVSGLRALTGMPGAMLREARVRNRFQRLRRARRATSRGEVVREQETGAGISG